MVSVATVLGALDKIATVAGIAKDVNDAVKDKYGIIEKQASIKYKGKEGRLVWDYILVNELTFEENDTGIMLSLGFSPSDEKIEEAFNFLVKNYGIE